MDRYDDRARLVLMFAREEGTKLGVPHIGPELVLLGLLREGGESVGLATVYRTVKLFEEAGILERLEFGDGRARYEDADRDHHDHLIDMTTGEVIEFVDPEIEALQERIARRLGYQIVDHRLELYARKLPEK